MTSSPVIARAVDDVRRRVSQARFDGKKIGFVPTMGALHAGHASLMKQARQEAGYVVVSIFVNPTQFGPNEDYSRYPRTWDADVRTCSEENVDLIFNPDARTMYPPGSCSFVEVVGLQDGLCGASRPGHFRGVATVVLKLFNIVQPDVAYFGQKDAQQARIIEQMAQDLDVPTQIVRCPIVREPDGLALSSRNRYLDPSHRRQAVVLSHALEVARNAIDGGERDAASVLATIKEILQTTPDAVIDYVSLVDAGSLQPVSSLRGEVLIALAVKFGTTRLIDNVQVLIPA